jgi:hypothetical protein
MRRHVDWLGPAAAAARGVEEPQASRLNGHREPPEPETLPGLDRALLERTPTLADPGLEAWCSFCCRPSREVGALVAGPAQAYVCRGCVELAASLLSGAQGARPGSAAPEDLPGPVPPATERPERASRVSTKEVRISTLARLLPGRSFAEARPEALPRRPRQ